MKTYQTRTGITLTVIDGGMAKPKHTPPKTITVAPLVFEKPKNKVFDFFHFQYLKIKS